jgi:hypothetical protein
MANGEQANTGSGHLTSDDVTRPNSDALTFNIFGVTRRGYFHVCAVKASTVLEAAAMHLDVWRNRKSPYAYMMRGPDGKRYSVRDSEVLAECPQ